MKKEMRFGFIEESHRDVANRGTDYRMVLSYRTDEKSLEIKMYGKRFWVTDTEMLQANHKDILEMIRKKAASEVFDRFYREHFIENPL